MYDSSSPAPMHDGSLPVQGPECGSPAPRHNGSLPVQGPDGTLPFQGPECGSPAPRHDGSLPVQGPSVALLPQGTMVAPIHVALSQCRLSFSEVTMGKKLIYRPLDKKTVSSLGKSMHFYVNNFFHALPHIHWFIVKLNSRATDTIGALAGICKKTRDMDPLL